MALVGIACHSTGMEKYIGIVGYGIVGIACTV